MIICICGKSGSGKSTIARELKKIYGDKIIHCDIDKIGHAIYENYTVIDEMICCFGKEILKDGKIDRKKLGSVVFKSSKEMDKLTDITWKYMEKEIDKIIEDNKNEIIILEWILLPKTKYFDLSDIKVLLDIFYEVRKERAVIRDAITNEEFDLRDNSSIKYDKTKFDLVLYNNDKNEIRKLVKLL